MMLKIMEMKSNEPKSTQKQNSKQLGYSDSTIERYRDDIQMDSPHIRIKSERQKINKTLQNHNPNFIKQMKN